MTDTPTPLHPRPIKAAHELMLAKLCALNPPRLTVSPEPDQFEAVSEYLLDVARIVDAMILEVGRDVKSNASRNIDLRYFDNVLRDGLEGFAVYSITEEIEALKEERAA